MDRRRFLQATAAAALTAQARAQQKPDAAVGARASESGSNTKLKVDAYSRHLQWLRTPDEVAEAVIEMGYEGLDLTVRPYPGHVDPSRVSEDLKPFVGAIRKHGIEVHSITCPITD